MTWQLHFTPNPDDVLALYAQIAQAIVDDIARGRLAAGQKLPGSRALAAALEVHRNTVIAAYDELIAQGWLEAMPATGTFVSTHLPTLYNEGNTSTSPQQYPEHLTADLPAKRPGEDIIQIFTRSNSLPMQGGQPDAALLPGDLLARAYRRALKRQGQAVLSYGDPMGYRPLRHEIARMLRARRALACNADQIMMTQGSQMALYLLAQVLCADGGVIGVEELGYRPAHAVMLQAGATLKPLTLDQDGVQLEDIELLARTGKLKAIYLTPHHQYPTMVQLAPSRRLALLELAATYRFLIIEDDYDNEFHYEGKPRLPLASADRAGSVVYVGTLSKVLAPGLRKGFVVAPRPLLARLSALRTMIDRQGDHVTEAALAELMEDGALASHIRKVQRIYARRRDHLCDTLSAQFEQRMAFEAPPGGMALWVAINDRSMGLGSWVEQAERQGVLIRAGAQFRVDTQRTMGTRHVRIGFAALDTEALSLGVSRLWQAWTQCGGR